METVKILLVEDDSAAREIYTQVLKDSGFVVDSASDGEEAWEKIYNGGYDLILLDVVMPKIDGMTILKKLQTNPPKQPNGKIVMLTVINQDAYIKEALSHGADGYLMKSTLTPQQIVTEIRGLLSSDKNNI